MNHVCINQVNISQAEKQIAVLENKVCNNTEDINRIEKLMGKTFYVSITTLITLIGGMAVVIFNLIVK